MGDTRRSVDRYKDPASFSRGRLVLIMIAVVLASSGPINDLILIPAANAMMQVFGAGVLNYILTGPSLLAVISAPVTGVLLKRISKKTMMTIGYLIFAVGGLLSGAMLESALFVCAMRTIVGIAVGIIAACSLAIIAESFVSENVRGTMMGIWNAGMALIGAAFSMTSGFLVNAAWQRVFTMYWVSIPILIVLFLFLPRTAPEREKPQAEVSTSGVSEGKMPWGRLTADMVIYFIANMVLCGFYYLEAVYVAQAQIGDATLAGIAGTCFTIGTLAGCFAFGPLYAKSKRWMTFEIFALLAVCFAMLGFSPAVATFLVASVVMGVANGFNMSYFQTCVTVYVPPSETPLALSITSAVLGVSTFCASYFATFVMGAVPNGTMVSFSVVSFFVAVVFAVIVVISAMRQREARLAT